MYVYYFRKEIFVDKWWDMDMSTHSCRMMIPGTYAEMHKDYD